MRIEQINENQIRCFLTREEMERRHLQLKELAYGTDKAKRLFHELMQEAYTRFGFEVQNMPVMIEAVPLHDNSLVLIITRVDNPEELDTRYSSFAPSVRSGADDAELPASSALSQLLDAIRQQIGDKGAPAADPADGEEEKDSGAGDQASGSTQAAGGTQQAAEGRSAGSRKAPSGHSRKTSVDPGGNKGIASPRPQLYTFQSLGRAADAACTAAPSYRGASALYRDPADSKYYLFLSPEKGISASDFTGALSVFSEFGTSEYITPAREQHLLEHCEVLCADNAVEKLAALAED